MNKKTVLFGLTSVFLMIAFLGLASAAVTITNIQPSLLQTDGTSFTFDVNFVGETGTYNISISNAETIAFTPNVTEITITGDSTKSITATYNASNFNFQFGKTYTAIIKVANSSNNALVESQTVSFEPVDYCENTANPGALELNIENVKVINGFGDDDNYWYPFDEVEVEVNVDNTGDWDIQDVEIEWALYTTGGKKIADDTLSDFKLKEGDDETVTFSFILNDNIDEFADENAILYVKAKGQIDDSNAGVYDNEYSCSSDTSETEVRADESFVLLNNFEMNGVELLNDKTLENTILTCNQEITINAEAWNIGDSDQQEVSVIVYSNDLSINDKIELGDIDSYDNANLIYTFTIPKNLEDKWYNIKFEVYDEDSDIFENSEDDTATFQINFKVEGCSLKIVPVVNAEMVSEEAIAGRDLIIKATLTNPSDKDVTYVVKPKNYETWASLNSNAEEAITIKAGESAEVELIFDTVKDSIGDQIFNLEVYSDSNELLLKQPIGVTIKDSNLPVADWIKQNWKLGGIILLNLILVIAIIIVAVRVYRR